MEKKSKNNIQWKRGSNAIGSPDKVHSLQYEQSSLLDKERQLDRLLLDMKSHTTYEVEENSKYTYLTSQDLNALGFGPDQMLMVVKAPSEAKLMVPEDNPLDLHLVSESDEITIFEVQSGGTTNSQTSQTSSVEDLKPLIQDLLTPNRKFKLPVRPGTSGSAQRNLCKEFDDVNGTGAGSEKKMTRLMGKSLFNDFGENLKVEANVEEPENYLLDKTSQFKSNITSEDLQVLGDPSMDSPSKYLFGTGLFGLAGGKTAVHRDVKLFSPQKIKPESATEPIIKSGTSFLIPDINLSPVYDIPGLDSKLFSWEPLTDYNFTLTDSEGVLDLFDYK